MTDYSELKRLLEACKESNCADASDFGRRIADLYDYLDRETVAEMVAENERLAALLECAQGDLRQAMQIIEKNSKDAESTPNQSLPPGCWDWVVPKGTKAPCRACSGFGTIETGIDEAPSTICSACNGTGEEP